MEIFDDADFIWTGFNLGILFYVLYDIYLELTTVFTYIARTGRQESIMITFVNRLSSKVYFILLVISAVVMFAVQDSQSLWDSMLIAPVALVIGFFIHSLISKICFINDEGMGSVSANFEMEIPWGAVKEFAWKNNVLSLTLKQKYFSRKKIKFSDSAAMLVINERLKNSVRTD